MAIRTPGTRRRTPSHDLRRRGRRTAALFLVLAAVMVVGTQLARGGLRHPAPGPSGDGGVLQEAITRGAASTDAGSSTPSPTPAPELPGSGSGHFGYALTGGPMLGRSGEIHDFQVAVEDGLGLDLSVFAASVDAILGDPRSWAGSGELRLRRVAYPRDADFEILLASRETSAALCANGGLDTGGYTSCQLGGQVVINADRWVKSVDGYGASLAIYQAYAINHEVGHQLGRGHEGCPEEGAPAPVMLQQTLGLQGCVANGWPYVGDALHNGPPAS